MFTPTNRRKHNAQSVCYGKQMGEERRREEKRNVDIYI